MKKAIVIGGSNGIGKYLANELNELGYELLIIDRVKDDTYKTAIYNLLERTSWNDVINEIKIFNPSVLINSAGIGKVMMVSEINFAQQEKELVINGLFPSFLFSNALNIKSLQYAMNLSSVSEELVSPGFASYASSKSYSSKFIETINCENAIREQCSLVITIAKLFHVKGTGFTNGMGISQEDKQRLKLALEAMFSKKELFFEKPYEEVFQRMESDKFAFAKKSYKDKIDRKDMHAVKSVRGYLTGSFDMLHYGHIRLIERAAEQCDELWVGIHESGVRKGIEFALNLDDRIKDLKSLKQITTIIITSGSDADDWEKVHYDKLFVGDDYKGTERFDKYEKQLEGKAKIVYFERTPSVSSSGMRKLIEK